MMSPERYSVIFLVDQTPPDKIILLKRAAFKAFAPNFHTGIGGKIGDLPEFSTETNLAGAYRELSEETGSELTSQKIHLTEFARCIYQDGPSIFYFVGEYAEARLPYIQPSDGTLLWVPVESLFDYEIIPTTKVVCREWARRGFSSCQPFTVFVQEAGVEKTVRLVKVLEVRDGLC